ncbi:MAG: LemA family protein [Candidatus Eisenbacteria bacterium]|uniref:LemA family protein n=1 Tax=Eiseniibacteriota bacterium TaxID=2212470 RepID=A0A938BML1_UNCEI|nr:LemA family protein [Candidatus Eisenbacteria bacterium]
MVVLLVLLGLLFLLIVWAIGIYNKLVRTRNDMQNAWSQIDVQLKRRYDLIPNLVETVKGYAQHERGTLEAVVKARQQAISVSADDLARKAQAENALSQTLRSLFAVAEAYPDLKANQNFLALQEELASTENKIGFARQYFNDAVMRLNNLVQMFPSNVFAQVFNFRTGTFFEVEEAAQRDAPKVAF